MNRHRPSLSEEMLNALIDDDFPPEDKAELMSLINQDPDLKREACELHSLKKQVQLAYQNVPEPEPEADVRRRIDIPWRSMAAAVMMLMIGGITGWSLRAPEVDTNRFVLLDPDGSGQKPVQAQSDVTRIVFHLTRPDNTIASELLDEVETLLGEYEKADMPLRVEIVAHAQGMKLLRQRLSQHTQRIASLSDRFENLTFVACRNTMDRLEVVQGHEVVLVPQAKEAESGVAHVVRRQAEGWVYIRV